VECNVAGNGSWYLRTAVILVFCQVRVLEGLPLGNWEYGFGGGGGGSRLKKKIQKNAFAENHQNEK
jgi:hypothetical protein